MFGFDFTSWTEAELLHTLTEEPVPRGAPLRLLVTANVDHIVQLRRNAAFRDAYRGAWKAVIDGTPVLLYARLKGLNVGGRITGADLFPQLMAGFTPGKHRPLILCPNDRTARIIASMLGARGFQDQVVITAPPKFEQDEAFAEWLVATARRQQTTHLILGLGAPKSEIWMHTHRASLPNCYGMAVGAAVEFYAGTKRRAPRLLQRMGLEFLWRALSEPRRLGYRYFVSSWGFLGAIWRDLRGGHEVR